MTTDKADVTQRLRTWTHAVDAVPASDLMDEAACEIDLLREAIRRYADQDATLSVCDGNVKITMDATLTDAERLAIRDAADAYAANNDDADCERIERTLRGLLDRLSPIATGDYPEPDNAPKQDTLPAQCSVQPEWMSKPYFVDPPLGHRYGFPKLYDPAIDGDVTAWMIANGYPQHLADRGMNCTFTATESICPERERLTKNATKHTELPRAGHLDG